MKHVAEVIHLFDRASQKKILAVLDNMKFAVENWNGDAHGELHVVMHTDAQVGIWQNEPDTFGTFDTFVHFSAGPNGVFTNHVPDCWKPEQGETLSGLLDKARDVAHAMGVGVRLDTALHPEKQIQTWRLYKPS